MTGFSPVEVAAPFVVAAVVLSFPLLWRLRPARGDRTDQDHRSTGGMARVRESLENSSREMGLHLNAMQMLLATAVVMLGGFAALFILSGQLLAGAVGAMFGGFTPAFLLRRGWVNRQRHIRQQLPAVLHSLAALDESGRPFPTALEETLPTTPAPLHDVLRRILDGYMAGLPVERAFAEQARRTGVLALGDIGSAAAIIRGDEKAGRPGTGGKLGDALRAIARQAMVEEQTFGGLRAKTTQARASAAVFLIVAFLCVAFFRWFNPVAYGPFTATVWFWGLWCWGLLILPASWLLTRQADRIVS